MTPWLPDSILRRLLKRQSMTVIFTNNFVPSYLGIMVTRQVQFCCIFAATKGKFDYFLKKLFHSSTSHTYHHNSSWFLSRHKNIYAYWGICRYLIKLAILIYPFLASNQSNVHAKNESLMQQIVDSSKCFLGQKYYILSKAR